MRFLHLITVPTRRVACALSAALTAGGNPSSATGSRSHVPSAHASTDSEAQHRPDRHPRPDQRRPRLHRLGPPIPRDDRQVAQVHLQPWQNSARSRVDTHHQHEDETGHSDQKSMAVTGPRCDDTRQARPDQDVDGAARSGVPQGACAMGAASPPSSSRHTPSYPTHSDSTRSRPYRARYLFMITSPYMWNPCM